MQVLQIFVFRHSDGYRMRACVLLNAGILFCQHASQLKSGALAISIYIKRQHLGDSLTRQ